MKELLTNTTNRLLCSAVESLTRAATEHRTQAEQSLELLKKNIREFRDIAAKILDVTLMGADRSVLAVEDPDRFFQMLSQMQSPFATPEILKLFPHVEIVTLIVNVMKQVLETLTEQKKEIPVAENLPIAAPKEPRARVYRGTSSPGGPLEQAILAMARKDGLFINTATFQAENGVSSQTVLNVLTRLVADGTFEKEGVTSKTRYILRRPQPSAAAAV